MTQLGSKRARTTAIPPSDEWNGRTFPSTTQSCPKSLNPNPIHGWMPLPLILLGICHHAQRKHLIACCLNGVWHDTSSSWRIFHPHLHQLSLTHPPMFPNLKPHANYSTFSTPALLSATTTSLMVCPLQHMFSSDMMAYASRYNHHTMDRTQSIKKTDKTFHHLYQRP